MLIDYWSSSEIVPLLRPAHEWARPIAIWWSVARSVLSTDGVAAFARGGPAPYPASDLPPLASRHPGAARAPPALSTPRRCSIGSAGAFRAGHRYQQKLNAQSEKNLNVKCFAVVPRIVAGPLLSNLGVRTALQTLWQHTPIFAPARAIVVICHDPFRRAVTAGARRCFRAGRRHRRFCCFRVTVENIRGICVDFDLAAWRAGKAPRPPLPGAPGPPCPWRDAHLPGPWRGGRRAMQLPDGRRIVMELLSFTWARAVFSRHLLGGRQ